MKKTETIKGFFIIIILIIFVLLMNSIISLLLSTIMFLGSFQNSLFYVDYQLNTDYYKALCVNKQKPEFNCNGKCQVKKESEKDNSPISEIKYAFELNILPTKSVDLEFGNPFEFKIKEKIVSINHTHTLDGYLKNGLQPPEILV